MWSASYATAGVTIASTVPIKQKVPRSWAATLRLLPHRLQLFPSAAPDILIGTSDAIFDGHVLDTLRSLSWTSSKVASEFPSLASLPEKSFKLQKNCHLSVWKKNSTVYSTPRTEISKLAYAVLEALMQEPGWTPSPSRESCRCLTPNFRRPLSSGWGRTSPSSATFANATAGCKWKRIDITF